MKGKNIFQEKETHKYDDIIHLPHHVSTKHPQMALSDRAAQFSPFAALTGHEDSIRETARRTEAFLELDEDKKEQLDEKMHVLQEYFSEKPEIMVTYFVPDEKKAGGAYVTHRGRIRKIDTYLRRLLFEDGTEVHMQYIFEMDADFSHNPNDLPRLYNKCAVEGYDVAIGSRYVSGVNVVNWPMGRVLMSYFASKYVRIITGLPIHDTTAGFKCYRREVLETIGLDGIRFKGYAFQIEMKFTAYKCGFKIAEVPVIFVNRELGTSKMNGSIFGEAVLGVIQLKLGSWFRKYPQKKTV